MSKPSWNDAPDWANYLAMDSDGDWYWYELPPRWDGFSWDFSGGLMKAEIVDLDASKTLEERP